MVMVHRPFGPTEEVAYEDEILRESLDWTLHGPTEYESWHGSLWEGTCQLYAYTSSGSPIVIKLPSACRGGFRMWLFCQTCG